MRRNIDRRQIDSARLAQLLGLVDTAEDVGELARPDPEIHLHLGVVEQTPIMPGRTDRHLERAVARMIEQIGPRVARRPFARFDERSEEHTSELQSLMRISYAVFCLKKKKNDYKITSSIITAQYTHSCIIYS